MFAKDLYHDLPQIQWQPPPLYFLHIPKTAGTSLELLLSQIYGRQGFLLVSIRNLAKIDPSQLGTYRCWRSHCGPGLIPFLPQTHLHCITMLRDPVEQMVSHIYHVRRHLIERPAIFETTYAQTMQPLIKEDLRTWLAHPNTGYFDNYQTRHLGSHFHLAPWFKTGEYGRNNTKPYYYMWLPPSLTDDSSMQQVLNRAYRQLQQMTIVGITEHFTESLELICALIGVPIPEQLPTENLGSLKSVVQTDAYRRQLAPDLIEQIEARNDYDRQLYLYACDLFAQQLARHRAKPKRSYSIAPRVRRTIKPWLPVVTQTIKQLTPQLTRGASVRRIYQAIQKWSE